MSYDVKGALLEVCTCDINCACCWSDDTPTGDACDRVIAWQITAGSADGVDLGGLTLAMVGRLDGDGAPVESIIFVPDTASEAQAEALVALWSGERGGPMADLARMLGTIAGVERTSIEYGEGGHLQIGTSVSANVPTDAPGTPVLNVDGQRAVHGEFHFTG